MLVLQRHFGETIYVGDDIVIQLVRSKNGRMGIGIEAPPADQKRIERNAKAKKAS